MIETERPRQKILIVEDHGPSRLLLQQQCEALCFEPEICAADEEVAWNQFQQDQPYLIILEWHLPGGAAPRLCRRIKDSPTGRYCTILMVTNQDLPIDHPQAFMAGATYCMNLPVAKAPITDWLAIAEQHMDNLLALEETVRSIDRYKLELEDVNAQLEESIERANQLAMDAEKAYVEVNQIFKTVAGGIVLINNECEILRHNETFLTMAGVTAEQAKSRKCYETFPSSLCHTPECPLTRLKNGEKRIESQIEKLTESGESIYYSIVSTPFRGLVGEMLGMVEHITDITTRVKAEMLLKESECRYKELSIIDELTGLFNKRHFNETLRNEIDRAKRYENPLSMIIMDIDNFKHYNDTYGHAEGDKVLAAMGRIIANSIRTIDRGNRYGGEEFTVILPETTGQEAVTVAERIRKTFASEEFLPKGERVTKTVSLGITQYQANDTPDTLLKRADKNLYQAKESGKNRYVLA